jgi:hypothetical protein
MIQTITLIVVSITFLYILFRFRGATKEQLDRDQLREEFRTFDLKLLFGFFLLIPTNIVVLTYLLTELSNIGFSSDNISGYIIRPNMGTWIVVSMMLSLATSVIILIALVKKIKGDRAPLYWKYYNLKYGFNAAMLLKYLSILIILFTATLSVSQMNTYVIFSESIITINKSLELSARTYQLSEIAEITHYQKTIAPNGKIVDKPHYGIEFTDGFVWRTNDDLRTPNINDDETLNWLIIQSGKQLKRIEIDEK